MRTPIAVPPDVVCRRLKWMSISFTHHIMLATNQSIDAFFVILLLLVSINPRRSWLLLDERFGDVNVGLRGDVMNESS